MVVYNFCSHDEKDQNDDCGDNSNGDDDDVDDNGNGDDDDDDADKTSDDVCWSPSLSLHTSLNGAPQKQTTHKGLIVSVTKMILTSCFSRSGEIIMIGLIIIARPVWGRAAQSDTGSHVQNAMTQSNNKICDVD